MVQLRKGMRSDVEVFGTRCLDVLSDEATLAILLHLREEPVTASQIEASVDGIGYRVALSRLRLLLLRGLVDLVDAGTVITSGVSLIG